MVSSERLYRGVTVWTLVTKQIWVQADSNALFVNTTKINEREA